MVWALVVVGLFMLVFAGDALVKGAVNLSLRIGIPPLIVGLTIVAMGTSAPELLVSIQAVLDGAAGIAMGNVVGSNIANILLVLGIPAIISGLNTQECKTTKSYWVMVGVALLFTGLAFRGEFDFISGLVLCAVMIAILLDAGRDAMRGRGAADVCAVGAEDDVEGADPNMPWWKIGAFLIVGLIGLPVGADLLVTNATVIARDYGVPETVIGLTLVAVGTSLPELATSVMAALRREADVALGNVIGSNIFNLAGIIGITSLIGNVPVDPVFLSFDLWVMIAVSILVLPFAVLKWNLTRSWGMALTALYAGYLFILL